MSIKSDSAYLLLNYRPGQAKKMIVLNDTEQSSFCILRIYYFLDKSTAAVNKTSVEEFNAVSVES